MEKPFGVVGISPTNTVFKMNFSDAIEQLINGEKVRRASWENIEVHLSIKEDKLCIYKTEEKKYVPLIVSIGDMLGEDWVTTNFLVPNNLS